MATTGHFSWSSFFALFSNDKGLRCRLNIPWTILLSPDGTIISSWVTNKEGHVVKQPSSTAATPWPVLARTLDAASQQQQPLEGPLTRPVAVARAADGLPHLLNGEQLAALATCLAPAGSFTDTQRASAEQLLAAVHWDYTRPPSVVQAYVVPSDNLRYITTYINTGHSLSCHSFPRLYSSRYQLVLGNEEAAAATGLGISQEALEEQQRQQREVAAAPVDTELKAALRQQTHHLVKYIQRSHGLTLKGLVAEYLVDATSGSLVLLALLRAEWASNAGGAGGGAFQQANLLLEPTEEPPLLLLDTAGAGPGELLRASLAGGTYQQQPSPRGTGSEEEGDAEGMPAPLRCSSPAGGATLGSSSRRGSPQPGSGPTGGGRCTSPLTNYPGGVQQAVSSGCTGGLSNSWPSLAHQAVMGGGDQLRSSGAAVATSRAGGRGEEGVGCLSSTTATVARCRSAQASGRLAPSGYTSSPGRPASSSPTRPPWGARTSGPSSWAALNTPSRPVSATTTPATSTAAAGALGATTSKTAGPRSTSRSRSTVKAEGVLTGLPAHAAHAVLRSAPGLTQLMAHEVEALQDAMQFQHRLAEASAAKVRQLEHDSAIASAAFEAQVSELSDALAAATAQVADLTQERDALTQTVSELSEQVATLSTAREALDALLQQERGTALATLREYQGRDAAATARTAQLEAECRRLEQQLKEEALTSSILKRQLLHWQEGSARGQEADPWGAAADSGLQEVLVTVAPLLQGQSNPAGEGYALQKVMGSNHPTLRSVFLHYAQLERSLGEHWPPVMTYVQWLVFAKETRISDPRAGARIRSSANDRMLSPDQLESLFTTYAAPDGGSALDNQPVLGYEAWLAALVATAQALKRPDQVYLSEMMRDLMSNYISRAHKVTPPGIKAGQVHVRPLTRVKKVPAAISRPATADNGRSESIGVSNGGQSVLHTAGPSRNTSVTLGSRSGRAGVGNSSTTTSRRPSTMGKAQTEQQGLDRHLAAAADRQQQQQRVLEEEEETWAMMEQLASHSPPLHLVSSPPAAAVAPAVGRPASAAPRGRPHSAMPSRGQPAAAAAAMPEPASAEGLLSFGSEHDLDAGNSSDHFQGPAAPTSAAQEEGGSWLEQQQQLGDMYDGSSSAAGDISLRGSSAGGSGEEAGGSWDPAGSEGSRRLPGGGDTEVEQQQLELHQLLQHMRNEAVWAQEAGTDMNGGGSSAGASSGGTDRAQQEQAGSDETEHDLDG